MGESGRRWWWWWVCSDGIEQQHRIQACVDFDDRKWGVQRRFQERRMGFSDSCCDCRRIVDACSLSFRFRPDDDPEGWAGFPERWHIQTRCRRNITSGESERRRIVGTES